RQNLRLAVDRGLSETDALAALTTVPAKLCGVQDRLGTIEPGKQAFLTVVDGKGYFDPEAKVREVWIDGKIYRAPAEEPKPAKSDEAKGAKSASSEDAASTRSKEEKPAEEKKDKRKEQSRELLKTRTAHAPLEGRGPIAEPKSVLIQNA